MAPDLPDREPCATTSVMVRALPEDAVAYKQTREFDEATIPAGLLADHRTKDAVWGRIVVLEGRLRYHVEGPSPSVQDLDPDTPGIVAPGVPHRVEPLGHVRFYVEFLRRDPNATTS
jgi:tellurite resistance-related uncharacterized protein